MAYNYKNDINIYYTNKELLKINLLLLTHKRSTVTCINTQTQTHAHKHTRTDTHNDTHRHTHTRTDTQKATMTQ